jgi:hypothetical protein
MIGFLEQFNKQQVSGWVKRSDSDNTVRLVFNGHQEFIVEASIERADLQDDGNGFIFTLPVELSSAHPLKIECYSSLGEELMNSPRTIETRDSEISKVLLGTESWLFLINDSNHSLDYLTCRKELPKSLLSRWSELIRRRQGKMASLAIPFVQIIIAEKEVVYHTHLPAPHAISPNRPILGIAQGLEGLQIPGFLYGPTPEDADNSEKLLYFKGDTHFSFHGAEFLTRKLLMNFTLLGEAHGLPPLEALPSYEYKKAYQVGDLISKCIGTNVELIDYPLARYMPITVCATHEPRAGRVRCIHNDQGSGRLLMFHTSSADWMAPFLNDTFRDVMYVWGTEVDSSIVAWFKPDYVAAQTNERFLTHCPVN